MKRVFLLVVLASLIIAGCQKAPTGSVKSHTLRLGYMANLTHAQALIGVADGSLERAAGVKLATKVFSAGPSAITALFAGEIDLAYVGPSPAVNGYIRSEGKALRIIAGGASGGAVFVVRPGFNLERLDGARLATPGYANTQDVSLRNLLREKGLRTTEQGGSVRVTPVAPADILGLFGRGQIDGAWVPEPWGARLELEMGARVAIDERDLWPDRRFATALLVVREEYLQANRETVKAFLRGHLATTRWIQSHPDDAVTRIQAALAKLQGRPMPDAVLKLAWQRLDILSDPMVQSVVEQAQRAYRLGFLGAREPDLKRLYDLTLLEEVEP